VEGKLLHRRLLLEQRPVFGERRHCRREEGEGCCFFVVVVVGIMDIGPLSWMCGGGGD
jgi:hypothetical protein